MISRIAGWEWGGGGYFERLAEHCLRLVEEGGVFSEESDEGLAGAIGRRAWRASDAA